MASTPSAASRSGRGTSPPKDKKRPTEATESESILFEWPVTGLRKLFEDSAGTNKSKVIRSTAFGGGKWTVLFYAQSGPEQNISLYLNAEPLQTEKEHPITTQARQEQERRASEAQGIESESKPKLSSRSEWRRLGVYRFTFSILTADKSALIASKEALGHAFSSSTSNWGWSGFASRDRVYYNNATVKEQDMFIITVSMSKHATPPTSQRPKGHMVSKQLIAAMGELLDSEDHSDTVFEFPYRLRQEGAVVRESGGPGPKSIYAIKSILCARSKYFQDLLDGGFAEGDDADGSDTEADDSKPDERTRRLDFDDDDDDIFHDSDAEYQLLSDHEYSSDAEHNNQDDEGNETDEEDESPSQASDGERKAQARDSDEDDGKDDSREFSQRSSSTKGSQQRTARAEESDRSEADDDEDDDMSPEDEIAAVSGHMPGNTSELKHPGDGSLSEERPVKTSSKEPGPAEDGLANRMASLGTSSDKGKKRALDDQSADGRATKMRNPFTGKKLRKVKILDSYYPSFYALLHWMYTDAIEFAPLTSAYLHHDSSAVSPDAPEAEHLGSMIQAHRRRARMIAYFGSRGDRAPLCSAKSIYKLADKMDIPELKVRAMQHIASSLSVHNIVWEVFSSFTARYPEVRKMEIEYLLLHFPEVKKTVPMKELFLRSAAHPGLAQIWPELLSKLEYKKGDEEDKAQPASTTASE